MAFPVRNIASRGWKNLFSLYLSRNVSSSRTVDDTVDMLARDLDSIDIEYAVVGGNALKVHGFSRFTDDVDVLVAKGGKNKIIDRIIGRGYVQRFTGAKDKFVNTVHNTNIDILEEGDYPGDGRPSQVPFPSPRDCSFGVTNSRGTVVKYIDLKTIILLKLASYQSLPDSCERDKLDVIDLLKVAKLDEQFADKLDPSVRKLFMQCLERARREMDVPDRF